MLAQAKAAYALFDQWPVSMSRRQSPVCASRAPVARPDQAPDGPDSIGHKTFLFKIKKIKSCVIC
jgi:hypothetical protein